MKTLIRTLQFEQGELYVIVDGRRILLANCKPKAEIYEDSTDIPLMGSRNCKFKQTYMTLVLCKDVNTTREVDESFLKTVHRFEMCAEIQRNDGIFERISFYNIGFTEIEEGGNWILEVDDPKLCRKLMEL